MSKQPAWVTPERIAHLAEVAIVAITNPDHKGCAAGHTTENHLTLCHDCWLRKKRPEVQWRGWLQCYDFISLVGDSIMPEMGDKDEHKRHSDGCALLACGLTRYTNNLILDWRDVDRQVKLAADDHERKHMHSLGEPQHFRRGKFGTISREVFHDNQNLYTVVGVSMDGLKGRPFAKIRMANSNTVLFVDLGDSLRDKKLRKKFIRRGKPTRTRSLTIAAACHTAVEHYLSH